MKKYLIALSGNVAHNIISVISKTDFGEIIERGYCILALGHTSQTGI